MRTSTQGGTLAYNEIITRNFLGMSQLNPARPYFPTGESYDVAARVQGKLPAEPPLAPKEGEEAKKADAAAARRRST